MNTNQQATPTPQKKTICNLEFTRQNGDQFLFIKAVPEVEKLFKTDETETSQKYLDHAKKGLKFYKLSPRLTDYINKYQTAGRNSYRGSNTVLTEYGTDLVKDNAFNISVLRTVGISKGIKVRVNDLVLDEQVQSWTREMAEFIKYLYHTFIEKTEIKATINLEI